MFKIDFKKVQILSVINFFLLIWGIFIIWHFLPNFGGDSEIHLIYAKNLLEGHVLEFNPGYKTGGETSPLYMLIVALMYLLAGDYTQYAMKALGVLSLVVICFILYNSTNGPEKHRKMLTWILFISMTFVPFQAVLGMENTLFASLMLLIIFSDYKGKISSEILPLVIPIMFLLRPEGVLLVIYFTLKGIALRNFKLIIFSIASGFLCIVVYLLLNFITGVDIQNAGSIRTFFSKIGSLPFSWGNHTFYISPKPLMGFAYAWVILVVIGIYRKKLKSNDLILLACFCGLPLVLHTLNIFPNVHFSRYVLYSYAILFFVFAQRIVPILPTKFIVIICLMMFSISVYEFEKRSNPNIVKYDVKDSVLLMSKDRVNKFSERLFNKLPKNKKTPIVIAATEVQLRGYLDDRFLIWPLDGITDAQFKKFIGKVAIDHFGYLKFREVDYLRGLPNHNIDKSQPSLASLKYKNNRTQCINGIGLTKFNPIPIGLKLDEYYYLHKIINC